MFVQQPNGQCFLATLLLDGPWKAQLTLIGQKRGSYGVTEVKTKKGEDDICHRNGSNRTVFVKEIIYSTLFGKQMEFHKNKFNSSCWKNYARLHTDTCLLPLPEERVLHFVSVGYLQNQRFVCSSVLIGWSVL